MKKLEYVRSKADEIYCCLCSILVVLAMNCRMDCVDGGRDSVLLNGMYKLWHSFYSCNFMDAFIIVAVFLLIRYVKSREKIYGDKWVKIFAMMLSVSYIISLSYCKYNSAKFLLEDRFQTFLSAICIVGYYIFIYYILCLLIMIIEKSEKEHVPQTIEGHFFHEHMWCAAFLIIRSSRWLIPSTSLKYLF